MEDNLVDIITLLVASTLQIDCPVLSGNMQTYVKVENIRPESALISVSGPSYDLKKWRKEGIIEHTGKYDYAVSVNNLGAFWGKSTKSKHWANRSIVNACKSIAQSYNAEVIVDVEL